MRTPTLLALTLLLTNCGAPTSSRPCTITLSGALTGSFACSSMNTKVMGLATADLNTWLVVGANDDVDASLNFRLPKMVSATTYVGGLDEAPSCNASVQPKRGTEPGRTAISRATGGGTLPPRGSCSITFTSVVEDSSRSTTSFVVQGSAKAKTINLGDMSTVDLDITF